jgi:hypothetical protein
MMLLVGFAYLLANAWWIRGALRRPAPPLEELVLEEGTEGPGD